MKKLLLTIFTIGAFANIASAQCNELFFSEYVEGTFNNKALEIFNPTGSAITLTNNYRIVRWSNGSSSSSGDFNYVQPLTGVVSSGGTFTAFLDKRNPSAGMQDTILFANLLAIADSLTALGQGAFYSPIYAAGVQGAKCLPFNGDDAISLDKNIGGTWVKVDIFGRIGEQPTNGNGTFSPSGGWTDTPPYSTGIGKYLTKDKTLIRQFGVQTGVTTNPAAFNALAEWDSLSVNTFSNLGSHECLCTVGINELKNNLSVNIYPNPSNNSTMYVRAADAINMVQLFDQFGRKVFEEKGNSFNKTYTLHTDGFSKGLYILSLKLQNGNSAVKKINIQ